MPVGGTANGAQAQLLRHGVAHLRDAAARDHDGHTHLGGFDDHLAGEAAGGVENFVRALHAQGVGCLSGVLHPHPARDGVDGVVAAHIFDKHQHILPLEQRAAVYRPGGLVGALLQPDGVDDAVELGLAECGGGQHQRVDVGHQVAKHTALAAAGGDHTAGGAFLDLVDARAGFDRRCTDLPVHRDGVDVGHRLHQPLVAQVTQHQQLGLRTQRHECDQLPFVHIDGECTFGGDGDGLYIAVFVDGFDRLRQWCTGLREAGHTHLRCRIGRRFRGQGAGHGPQGYRKTQCPHPLAG